MARKKYKMTGCARFFIALLIIAPLAYIGASYYNGENPFDNIRALLGMHESTPDTDEDTYSGTSGDLQKKLDNKDKSIRDLQEENAELKERIDNLEKEIKYLKQRLDARE